MKDIFDSRYYRFLKFIFLCHGLWPFQKSIYKILGRSVTLLALISIMMPKLIKLGEEINNFDGIIQCMPMIGLHACSFSKFFNWIFNAKKMKNLLLHIQRDWNYLQLSDDVVIMHKYCERGNVINLLYSCMSNYLLQKFLMSRDANFFSTSMFSILALYLASPSIPILLDKVNPLNETRNRIYLYETEYFVDPDEYYISILIHAYITVPVSVSVLIFVDTMFAMYVHHACAMFAALRYRLENLYNISDGNVISNKKLRSKKIYQEITLMIKMHSNVLEFSKELESSGTICNLIVITINLSMITLCGIVTVMKMGNPSESIRFLAFTLGDIFHLFFSSFQGQKLIDESENVFYSTYMSDWYRIPTELQKHLIPIMVRSITPCKVTAGSVYIISMDTFSVMLKNAMSFFTVISSTR